MIFKKLRCNHAFEFITAVNIFTGWSTPKEDGIPNKIRHVYVCKKCLKKKVIRL